MLTDYQIALWWMRNRDDRKIEISHGGTGGKYYAKLIEDDAVMFDGVGESLEDAVGDAACRHISIESLMQDSE